MQRWVVSGVVTLVPGLVIAQGDDAVVVTATRVDRPSLEVPASIDRVRADDIRAMRGMVDLSEALSRVPGIVVQSRQNYAQDLQMSSRGFGARASFGVRGLRILVDGIPASMPDGQGQVSHFDLGSAARIEVLRGPFSVMHGNAAGGVISLMTGSAGAEPEATLNFAAGSHGTRRVSLKAAGATRAVDAIGSVARFRTQGYRAHSAARRDQLNGKLVITTEGGTRVRVVGNALAAPAQDPVGLTRAQLDADRRSVAPQAIAFDTRKNVHQEQAGVVLEHDAGGARIEAAAYAGQRALRQYLAFAGGAATSAGGVVDLDRHFGGGAVRLAGDAHFGGRPLTWVVGGELEQQDERRRGYVNLSGSLGRVQRDEDDRVRSTGLYAQAEWRFADRWIGIAGLRSSQVEFRSRDHFITAGNPDDSGTRHYRATTPVAGLVYRLAPTSSVYVNAGRGFETPTFAELAYRPGGGGLNFALEAGRSRHLEAGVKAVVGRARLNAAVFDVATRDEIVVDTALGGRTTYRNAGRTTRRGLELGVEGDLGTGFEASLAWTLLEARFRDSFVSQNATVTVPDRNRLPGVPRSFFSGALRWQHVPSGFSAALEVQHKSAVAVDDVNSESAAAWTTANVALGVSQRFGRWVLREFLRIDNAADRRYVGTVIVNDGNGRYYEPAPGRNVLLGVEAHLSF